LKVLVDKTESLRYQADVFQKSGKALRNKMWWQNIKMKLLVGLILAIVIVVIFCFACFSGGKNCTKHSGACREARVEQRLIIWPRPTHAARDAAAAGAARRAGARAGTAGVGAAVSLCRSHRSRRPIATHVSRFTTTHTIDDARSPVKNLMLELLRFWDTLN